MSRVSWGVVALGLWVMACGDDALRSDAGPADSATSADSGGPLDSAAPADSGSAADSALPPDSGEARGCGNGVVEDRESCDDMNEVAGDGCEADCTFSCIADEDCDDLLSCTGTETCAADTHVCQPGTPLDCSDGDDCTDDLCDDVMGGCLNPLIDMDGDGHAPTTLGACGTDCDDDRMDVHPDAEELCDGIDNNCNIDIDEVAPTWYVDCDGDGYAAGTDSSRVGCVAPPPSATGCGGAWVSARPVGPRSTDCDDGNPDMFPGQTTYFTSAHGPGADDDTRYGSYDCSGTAQYDHGRASNPSASCALATVFFTNMKTCRGTGWTSTSAPRCGGSGTYVSCGSAPTECTAASTTCSRTGYSLVCEGAQLDVGDPCYCRPGTVCTATCTPGSRGCPWHYYRCDAVPSTETMGCR